MSQRLNYNAAAPAGMKALGAVYGYVRHSGLPSRLFDLVFLRVSQLNGCAYCIDTTNSCSSRRGTRWGASSASRRGRRSRGRKT